MVKVAVSGYFDPLHVGHLNYLRAAKALGDWLVVIVNNTEQTVAKSGKEFLPLAERVEILKELRCVDEVVVSIDKDRSVCETLKMIGPDIFANGGDRHAGNIPEANLGIKLVDGVGGGKVQSSSWLKKNSLSASQ